jgi:hypothetical protein
VEPVGRGSAEMRSIASRIAARPARADIAE